MRALITLLLVCLATNSWSMLRYPSKSSLCVAYIAQQTALENRSGFKDTREKTIETLRSFRATVLGAARQSSGYKPVQASSVSGSFAKVAERIGGIESDKRLVGGPQLFAASFHGAREIEGFFRELDKLRSFAESLLRTEANRYFWGSSVGLLNGLGAAMAAETIRTGATDSATVSIVAFAAAVDLVVGAVSATDFSDARNREQLVAFLSRDPSAADPDEWSYTGRNYRMQKALVAALQDATPDLRLKSGGSTQGFRDHHMLVMGIPAALLDKLQGDQPYSAVLVDEFLHRHPETGEPIFSFVLRIYQDRPPRPRRRRFTERFVDWGREGMQALLPPSVAPSPQSAP